MDLKVLLVGASLTGGCHLDGPRKPSFPTGDQGQHSAMDHVFNFDSEKMNFVIHDNFPLFPRPFRKSDIMTIKELTINEISMTEEFYADDFKKLPHLEKITIVYRTETWLVKLLKITKDIKVADLTFKPRDTNIRYAYKEKPIDIDKISGSLNALKKLRSLYLSTVNASQITGLNKKIPLSTMHFEVRNLKEQLTDEHIDSLAKLKNLQSLSLTMPITQLAATRVLPTKIASVKFFNKEDSGEISECNIDKLMFMKSTAFATIGGCKIESLRSTVPMAWQALLVVDSVMPDSPKKDGLDLPNSLPHLHFFKSRPDNMVTLNARSLNELKKRASLRQANFIQKILDYASSSCENTEPVETSMSQKPNFLERMFSCMDFKRPPPPCLPSAKT